MGFRKLSAVFLFAVLCAFASVQAMPAPKALQENIIQRSTPGSTQPHSYFIIVKKDKDAGDQEMDKLEKRVCYGSCGGHAAKEIQATCTAVNHCRQ